jgi:hypothetical protein
MSTNKHNIIYLWTTKDADTSWEGRPRGLKSEFNPWKD